MSYEHFQKHNRFHTFHTTVTEEQHPIIRNGTMKRRRDGSPLASHWNNNNNYYTADDPCFQSAKRLKRSGLEVHNTSINSCGGMVIANTKSDDEISLVAEETPKTLPALLPQHSRFVQSHAPPFVAPPPPTRSKLPPIQRMVSDVTDAAPAASYATDYQPMNSLLGNLHLMRQQQQQRRQQQALRNKTPAHQQGVGPLRHHPQQQQQQHHAQHSQNQYPRHYGNYHSVPTTSRTKNQSQRKGVSLRVSSNLY